MARNVIFDVTSKTVENVAEQISKQHEDRLMVIAPLAGSISVHAPSKSGKHKGYHRFKFEVWIPEDAIKGDSALNDFGAVTLMTLPKNRVNDHLKNDNE